MLAETYRRFENTVLPPSSGQTNAVPFKVNYASGSVRISSQKNPITYFTKVQTSF